MKYIVFAIVFGSSAILFADTEADEKAKKIAAEIARIENEAERMRTAGEYPLKLEFNEQGADRMAANMLFNETGCKPENIVYWSPKEEFPSLGMLHTIWFPPGLKMGFTDSFPTMWRMLRERANAEKPPIPVPAFLQKPGSEKTAWYRTEFKVPDRETHQDILALKTFLLHPKVLQWQSEGLVERGRKAMHLVLASIYLQDSQPPNTASPKVRKERTERAYRHLKNLMSTEEGMMAVVDYTSFKGEGIIFTQPKGSSHRVMWGLRAVIEEMDREEKKMFGPNATEEEKRKAAPQLFGHAADTSLRRLAAAYPVASQEHDARIKYLERDPDGKAVGGWAKRIDRMYKNGGIQPGDCPMWKTQAPKPVDDTAVGQ